MKKILVLFLLLFSAVSSDAAEKMELALSPAVMGGASSCMYTAKVTHTGTGAFCGVGFSTTIYGCAHSFTGVETIIKRISVWLKYTGTPPVPFTTVTFYICADDGGTPNHPTSCTAMDTTFDTSVLTDAYAEYTFNYAAGYSLSAVTTYWIAAIPNGNNSSNYVLWERTGSGSYRQDMRNSVGTWSNNDATSAGHFTLYSCD